MNTLASNASLFITTLLITGFILVGVIVMIARFYKKVDQGRALIINKVSKEPVVTFTGGLVLPIVHRGELMDISVKTIDIDRRGKEGLICMDNIRADIKVAFFVRVNKTADDVLKVAQSIGCQRASSQATLENLFVAKFSEALKTVGKRLNFEDLYTKRDGFRDQIITVIGKDLNGYVLEDAAIDYLEQTELEQLDPNNILDAHGIRKITEITCEQSVHTNGLKQEGRKAIKKQDVEAAEAIFELERQEADAKAKQEREIAIIAAREEAETLKVQAEERQKSELARLKVDEDLAITEENKTRQIEVAQKNRERVIKVESERVERDRQLEAVSRERDVELQVIEKEKLLEREKKVIAEAIASRIAVEKGVAAEEERIKDLRTVALAKREKDAAVITAEGKAEEHVIQTVKEAEAKETIAKHQAKERITLADAELEAADREAQSKMRIAEGIQAETAAAGLADVKVKEADAAAILKQGRASAEARELMMNAEASGDKSKGMSEVDVQSARADAIEKVGMAEAAAIKVRMEAEAQGLQEKLQAMQNLDPESRRHEEYRIQLEQERIIRLQQLTTQREIAEQQAKIMGTAMENAKVNIVGGDGTFLEKFFNGIAVGKSMDVAIDQSEVLSNGFGDYLDGKANLREDLAALMQRQGPIESEDLKNLSIAMALRKLSHDAG